ncbi:unnamed protein product [Calypogeia fissa]
MPPGAGSQVSGEPPILVLLEVHMPKLSAMDILEQLAPMQINVVAKSTATSQSAAFARLVCTHRLVISNLLSHLLQIPQGLSEGPGLFVAASVHLKNFNLSDDAAQDQGHRNPRDGALEGALPSFHPGGATSERRIMRPGFRLCEPIAMSNFTNSNSVTAF